MFWRAFKALGVFLIFAELDQRATAVAVDPDGVRFSVEAFVFGFNAGLLETSQYFCVCCLLRNWSGGLGLAARFRRLRLLRAAAAANDAKGEDDKDQTGSGHRVKFVPAEGRATGDLGVNIAAAKPVTDGECKRAISRMADTDEAFGKALDAGKPLALRQEGQHLKMNYRVSSVCY